MLYTMALLEVKSRPAWEIRDRWVNCDRLVQTLLSFGHRGPTYIQDGPKNKLLHFFHIFPKY